MMMYLFPTPQYKEDRPTLKQPKNTMNTIIHKEGNILKQLGSSWPTAGLTNCQVPQLT